MKRFHGIFLCALCLALVAAQARAQLPYPSRTVRVLVPYAPGGLTDVVARLYSEQMRRSLGQAVVVENKPGASGIIAIEEMARSKPDGYTLLIGNISTNGLTPVLLAKKLRIDYDREVQTFAEFLAYARARPGDVRYASAGIGSYQQVNTEILAKRAGISLLHVPFKDGGSGMLRDLVSGEVQVSWFNVTNPVGMMKAGRVRALAVAAPHRLAAHPDVPTMAEVGFPGVRASQWVAAFAPSAVPAEIVETLHNAFMRAASVPEMQEAFRIGGMAAPTQSSVSDARAWLREEMASWKRDVAELDIVVDE